MLVVLCLETDEVPLVLVHKNETADIELIAFSIHYLDIELKRLHQSTKVTTQMMYTTNKPFV